jgi:hypothetical protein
MCDACRKSSQGSQALSPLNLSFQFLNLCQVPEKYNVSQ